MQISDHVSTFENLEGRPTLDVKDNDGAAEDKERGQPRGQAVTDRTRPRWPSDLGGSGWRFGKDMGTILWAKELIHFYSQI